MSAEVYKFKVKRSKGTPENKNTRLTKQESPEIILEPFGSLLEQWVYKALLALEWKKENIELQRAVMGGRRIKGGHIADIILYKPTPCVISVKGEYWHPNDQDEFIEDTVMMNMYPDYIVVWGRDISSYEAALSYLAVKVGRP